jgi:dimeric dUTPase (all-alpha-NTP-PPase superfamily)
MNLKYMIELQGGLMEHIKKAKGIMEIPFDETELAFKVELGECANEWRGFKYWSKRNRWDIHKGRERTLEEYVDGLSFAMQLCILDSQKNGYNVMDLITEIENEIKDTEAKNVIDQFNNLYYHASVIGYDHNFALFMATYMNLGRMLGFSDKEIELAYCEKNEINHNRQLTGY